MQRLEFGQRLLLREFRREQLAHDAEVLVRIGAERLFRIRNEFRELHEMPVEVLAAAEIEAADELTEHVLTESDRIRHRHEHDLRVQRAGFLELPQTPLQQHPGQHSGRFVGVQRRLDLDLLPAIGRAEMKRHQFAVGADCW
ncbi:hypothetical protein OKW42_002144 [Paraburkholderia sp. WC7.3d]